MPCDRGTPSGFLDEYRLVEGNEIVPVHRRGDSQQIRVAIDPQMRVGEPQRTQDQIDNLFRRIGRCCRLKHLYRVTAASGAGAPERIA
jgi:hypothetical protein